MSDVSVPPATLCRRVVKLGENVAISENLKKSQLSELQIVIHFTEGFAYKIDRISKFLAENARSRKNSQKSKLSELQIVIHFTEGFPYKIDRIFRFLVENTHS